MANLYNANTADMRAKGSPFMLIQSGSTIYQLPVIKASTLNNSVSEETDNDEAGTVYTFDGDTQITFTTTVMQTDPAVRNLVHTLPNSNWQILKEVSRVPNAAGKIEYLFIPEGKLLKNVSIDHTSRELELTWAVTPNATEKAFVPADWATYSGSLAGNLATMTLTVSGSEGWRYGSADAV